jgi:hypothetical protein
VEVNSEVVGMAPETESARSKLRLNILFLVVNLGRPWNENSWYILWPFGIYYGHLANFIAI